MDRQSHSKAGAQIAPLAFGADGLLCFQLRPDGQTYIQTGEGQGWISVDAGLLWPVESGQFASVNASATAYVFYNTPNPNGEARVVTLTYAENRLTGFSNSYSVAQPYYASSNAFERSGPSNQHDLFGYGAFYGTGNQTDACYGYLSIADHFQR
jgi:hypothetical protein